MDEIRIGVLGFAHGHVPMYCSRWREKPELGVRVVAGWDHDAARLFGLTGPLAECLHGRRPPIATVEEGRDVLRVVLACYDAAGQGRKIALN
jgi:predicted dehydrogenase